METLQDYIDYLISQGYKISERGAFTYTNGCLTGIDMISPSGKFAWMECEPSEEFRYLVDKDYKIGTHMMLLDVLLVN